MKRTISAVVRGILLLTTGILAGCGSNGGYTQKVISTAPVSTVALKSYFVGTAAAGSELRFNLKGSDTNGGAWTGSTRLISDGTTVFEEHEVTASRQITTLTYTATGYFYTRTLTRYYLTSDGSLYKVVDANGVTSVPASPAPLAIPDTVYLGDKGSLWDLTGSDGSAQSIAWILDGNIFNSNDRRLQFSTSYKASGSAVSTTEQDIYYLTSAGNPYGEALVVPLSGGMTLYLAGDRVDPSQFTNYSTQ